MLDKKLLAIDIGNTNINFGLFKGNTLVRAFKISTKSASYQLSGFRIQKTEKVIVASVVPQATKKIITALKKMNLPKPIVVGKDIIVPITNRYKKPKQVGQDRLVNAYGAMVRYGKPLIIIDFGTAVTFDVVSKKGEYIGGIIAPGIETALKSLYYETALLPLVKLGPTKELIGRDTASSIKSGILFGYASLCDGLVDKLKKKIGRNALVILTGGASPLISKYAKSIDKVDLNLTLKSLLLIFQGEYK